MISQADVVEINVPFPNTDPKLALQAHMFICIQDGNDKEFVICQSFKPTHLLPNYPPKQYLIEEKNENRNPFSKTTTIDCDRSFCICSVTIDKKILAYRNVCCELFDSIIRKIKHSDFYKEYLDPIILSIQNHFIYPKR